MKKNCISLPQAVLFLFLCRMFLVITYSPSAEYAQKVESNALLFGGLIGLGITFLVLLPLFCLFRDGQAKDFLLRCDRVHARFGTIVRVYLLFLFLFVCVGTTTQFSFFMTNAIFPQASSALMIITLVGASLYGAYMGLEGLARAGSIIFILFSVSVLFILIFSHNKIEWAHWYLLSNTSWKAIWSTALDGVSKNMELALILVLLPRIRANFTKTTVWYVFSSAVVLNLIGASILLVLGKFAIRQVFPFYTVASIVETGLLQRLDALHMALWVLIAFLRLAIYLLVGGELLKKMMPYRFKKWALAIVGFVTLIVSLVSTLWSNFTGQMNTTINQGILLGIALILFPLILLVAERKGET